MIRERCASSPCIVRRPGRRDCFRHCECRPSHKGRLRHNEVAARALLALLGESGAEFAKPICSDVRFVRDAAVEQLTAVFKHGEPVHKRA
jgi:hypothetical protein